MRKGPFAPPREFENGVMFDADEEIDTKYTKKWEKKNKKHNKKHGKKGSKKDHKKKADKKHKKRHGCCLAPLVTIALIFGHLFQLRNLSGALAALESLGGNMKDLKKQEKKPVVVADEETASEQIEYTFDEHLDEE